MAQAGVWGPQAPTYFFITVRGRRSRPRITPTMTTYTEQAETILNEWVASESLKKHVGAVAASMRQFAQRSGGDPDLWYAVGLLHDMDYERYPDLGPGGHPFVGVDYLREHGWSDEVCRAILSHAEYSSVSRESPMEKTLFAVDELSSFALAVAMVKPTKSIFDVDVASVRKKMKDKAFARAVSRDDITQGAQELGMPLDDLIGEVLTALQADAGKLGAAGIAM